MPGTFGGYTRPFQRLTYNGRPKELADDKYFKAQMTTGLGNGLGRRNIKDEAMMEINIFKI